MYYKTVEQAQHVSTMINALYGYNTYVLPTPTGYSVNTADYKERAEVEALVADLCCTQLEVRIRTRFEQKQALAAILSEVKK